MSNGFKCFFGMHEYEILGEEEVKFMFTDIVVSKAIVSRCKHCGKIMTKYIDTVATKER